MSNLQEGVRRFLVGVGQSVDRFNPVQATLYTGLQLEEMAEKIHAISGGALTADERAYLEEQSNQIKLLGNLFKSGKFMGNLGRAAHEKLIDADFDLAFVSLGALYSTSIDGDGAIAEGCASNMAKLVDGKAVRDTNGKIKKPAGWVEPDFTKFVDAAAKED